MNKKRRFIIKECIILFILTSIFTIIVFFIKNYYFSDDTRNIEEKYIEPVVVETIITEQEIEIKNDESKLSNDEINSLIQEHYSSASDFHFEYFPESFETIAQ